MEHAFWHKTWADQEIGFHKSEVHPFLKEHLPGFDLPAGARIFVPLCGKTLDMAWLLSEGFRVVGVELVETAVAEFFENMGVVPHITEADDHIKYASKGIDLFVGDVLALTQEQLGTIDLIYDRAALIALPEDMAARYADHLISLSKNAPQMLIGFEYDQTEKDGPPFALMEKDVQAYYGRSYVASELGRKPLDGGLKGDVEAVEIVRALYAR